MAINMKTAKGARDFALSWVDTVDQNCSIEKIKLTIFEWPFWRQIFSPLHQNGPNMKGENSNSCDRVIAIVIGLPNAFYELHKTNQLVRMARECPKDEDEISVTVQNALEILERRIGKLRGYCTSTTGLLISGAAVCIAALFAIPIIIKISIVIIALFAFNFLYTAIAHWSDEDDDLLCYQTIQSQHGGINEAYQTRIAVDYLHLVNEAR